MRKLNSFLLALTAVIACGCGQTSDKNLSGVQDPFNRVCITDETTITHTIYGDVQGYKDGDIFTFKGIQYAKADRFMPPQAPDAHEGVLKCRVYGPKAPQGQNFNWSGNPQTEYAFGNQFFREPMDEAGCLVLNVWTKGLNDGKKRPVFVWIHGGGYSSGSGHDLPCYEGRALAEKGDIVTVNLNHRLNILGYTDLTALGGPFEHSVNLGMQDIVKALEWIRDNIEYFGGDPSNVTIGGQSGGGGKVSTLLAMPSAKGLFHKAIIQSGSTLRQSLPENTQPAGLAFAKEIGVTAANPEKFNDYTYAELNAAYSRAMAKLAAENGGRRMGGGSPVVDGYILPEHPFDGVAAATCADVPVIIGTDLNEFSFENFPLTEAEAKEMLLPRYGDRTDEYMAAFKKVYPTKNPRYMVALDLSSGPNSNLQATIKSAQPAKVFHYLFTWTPTANYLGASHGMELPFMFNNVMLQPEMTGNTPEAHALEALMSSAWIAFVKTGDPNTPGLPTWEPLTADNNVTMVFDNECYLRENGEDVQALYSFTAPPRR